MRDVEAATLAECRVSPERPRSTDLVAWVRPPYASSARSFSENASESYVELFLLFGKNRAHLATVSGEVPRPGGLIDTPETWPALLGLHAHWQSGRAQSR